MARIIYPTITQPPPSAFTAISQFEASWHQPWSEPVRSKPRLQTGLQQAFFPPGQLAPVNISWFAPLSIPVRTKPRLLAGQNPYFFFEPEPPILLSMAWYQSFAEPKRFKQGLPSQLQRYFEGPPRLLPTPTVFAVLSAVEVNSDVFLGAINVYDGSGSTTSGAGARVSIVEVKVGGDPVSVIEQ